MKKQYLKKGQSIRDRYKDQLSKTVKLFVEDCKDKTEIEVKELYIKYEKTWRSFANRMNNQHRANKELIIVGFTDAFESTCHNAYKMLPDYKKTAAPEDYMHMEYVFNIVRERNVIQRLFHFIGKKLCWN